MMKRINKKNQMSLKKNQNQNQMRIKMMMKFVYHNLERNQRKLLKES